MKKEFTTQERIKFANKLREKNKKRPLCYEICWKLVLEVLFIFDKIPCIRDYAKENKIVYQTAKNWYASLQNEGLIIKINDEWYLNEEYLND